MTWSDATTPTIRRLCYRRFNNSTTRTSRGSRYRKQNRRKRKVVTGTGFTPLKPGRLAEAQRGCETRFRQSRQTRRSFEATRRRVGESSAMGAVAP